MNKNKRLNQAEMFSDHCNLCVCVHETNPFSDRDDRIYGKVTWPQDSRTLRRALTLTFTKSHSYGDHLKTATGGYISTCDCVTQNTPHGIRYTGQALQCKCEIASFLCFGRALTRSSSSSTTLSHLRSSFCSSSFVCLFSVISLFVSCTIYVVRRRSPFRAYTETIKTGSHTVQIRMPLKVATATASAAQMASILRKPVKQKEH